MVGGTSSIFEQRSLSDDVIPLLALSAWMRMCIPYRLVALIRSTYQKWAVFVLINEV